MPTVIIQGLNIDKWTADMSRFATQLNYQIMKEAGEDVIKIMEQIEKDQFSSTGSKGKHGKWPPLEPEYAAWKEKNYSGRPLMVLTGRLIKSLTGQSGDSIRSVSKSGDSWYIKKGTVVERGEYHQKGIDTKRGKKIRRTVDPTDQQARQMVLAIQKRVVMAARRSGAWDKVDFAGIAQMDRHMVSI